MKEKDMTEARQIAEQCIAAADNARCDGVVYGGDIHIRIALDFEKVARAYLALEARCAALDTALIYLCAEIDLVMSDSRGVDGWHLNGDIAKWDEFADLDEALTKACAALDNGGHG